MHYIVPNNYIYHHGILGQKWGIRRYQPYPSNYHGKGKFVNEEKKLRKDLKTTKNTWKRMKIENRLKEIDVEKSTLEKVPKKATFEQVKEVAEQNAKKVKITDYGYKQLFDEDRHIEKGSKLYKT